MRATAIVKWMLLHVKRVVSNFEGPQGQEGAGEDRVQSENVIFFGNAEYPESMGTRRRSHWKTRGGFRMIALK